MIFSPLCFDPDSGRSCNACMTILVNRELRSCWKKESMCEEWRDFVLPPRMLSGVGMILRQTGLLNPCEESEKRRVTRRDD